MILGLDVSTTCTGYCVYDGKNILEKGFIKLEGELYERADVALKKLDEKIDKWNIDKIHIEDFLMKFAPGRSSAFSINKLISFNSIISYHLYKRGLIVKRYNVLTARKKLFGQARNKFYKNTKQFVLAMLKIKLGQEFVDSLPRNTRDNIAAESYDVCDAVVMALQ